MALFLPITDPARLPQQGAAHEHDTLDAKLSARKWKDGRNDFERPEMAKDIAAFANALGGTLLIGAHEDLARGVIDRFEPLGDVDAEETLRAYEAAVQSFCSPHPIIVPAKVPVPGGVLVAVNVWPFPGQIVGCSSDGAGVCGRRFAFPLRVGRTTAWIEPAQIPMFSDPRARRIALALEAIPRDKRSRLTFTRASSTHGPPPASWQFHRVDILANAAFFVESAGNGRWQVTGISLDDIETVWNGGERWCIRLGDGARWSAPTVVDSLDGV